MVVESVEVVAGVAAVVVESGLVLVLALVVGLVEALVLEFDLETVGVSVYRLSAE
jgi:hypothetical protein